MRNVFLTLFLATILLAQGQPRQAPPSDDPVPFRYFVEAQSDPGKAQASANASINASDTVVKDPRTLDQQFQAIESPALLASVSGAAAQTIPAPANAQIRGSVVGEDGKAIASARVNAQFWPVPVAAGPSPYAPGPGQKPQFPKLPVGGEKPVPAVSPHSVWVQSDPDGSFSLTNLPAGSYRVCAQLSNSELINSCAWEALPKTWSVAAGQTATVPAIVLTKSYRLQIHIDDQAGLLARHEGISLGARLIVGGFTPAGLFIPATRTGKGLTAQDHSVLVPYGTPVRVGVSSGFFSVGDEAGKPLAQTPGAGPVVQVPRGSVAAPVRFTITGLKPGAGN